MDRNNAITCVLVVQTNCVCVLLQLRWRSDHILRHIYTEMQVIPKGSLSFFYHCTWTGYQPTPPKPSWRPHSLKQTTRVHAPIRLSPSRHTHVHTRTHTRTHARTRTPIPALLPSCGARRWCCCCCPPPGCGGARGEGTQSVGCTLSFAFHASWLFFEVAILWCSQRDTLSLFQFPWRGICEYA